ncbi:hypothetical protein BCR33DRAFT_721541, partial [Rhizoclosmatium globosum]
HHQRQTSGSLQTDSLEDSDRRSGRVMVPEFYFLFITVKHNTSVAYPSREQSLYPSKAANYICNLNCQNERPQTGLFLSSRFNASTDNTVL